MVVCNRTDARQKTEGFSPVSPDVLNIVVREPEYWDMLAQTICICKPLVDAIGNIESRDATLADCMIELLRIARILLQMKASDNEDEEFLEWARAVFNREFHKIHTDIHHLTLFLHPLCRNLALSDLPQSRTLSNIIDTALNIAKRLGWDEIVSRKLVTDIIDYEKERGPFSIQSGRSNPVQWWDRLSVVDLAHPLRMFAILILSIVPHAAEVERLFSNLGGVQSVRRSRMTIEVLSMLGTIRSQYAAELQEDLSSRGIDARRRHAHMHTEADGGSHTSTIDDLIANLADSRVTSSTDPDPTSVAPSAALPSTPPNMQDPNAPAPPPACSQDELELAFAKLDLESYGEPDIDPHREGKHINAAGMYPLHELNAVLAGDSDERSAPQTAMQLGTGSGTGDWTVAGLMDSMGLSR